MNTLMLVARRIREGTTLRLAGNVGPHQCGRQVADWTAEREPTSRNGFSAPSRPAERLS